MMSSATSKVSTINEDPNAIVVHQSMIRGMAMKERHFQWHITLINIVTYLLIAALFVDFTVQTSRACINNDLTLQQSSNLYTWIFTVLGSVFFMSGVVMALSVHKYYPDFYKEYGKLVWLATFFLAAPLFVRAVNSNLYAKEKKYYNFYQNNFALMNIAYVTTSSILPVVAQTTSLVFGAR